MHVLSKYSSVVSNFSNKCVQIMNNVSKSCSNGKCNVDMSGRDVMEETSEGDEVRR